MKTCLGCKRTLPDSFFTPTKRRCRVCDAKFRQRSIKDLRGLRSNDRRRKHSINNYKKQGEKIKVESYVNNVLDNALNYLKEKNNEEISIKNAT